MSALGHYRQLSGLEGRDVLILQYQYLDKKNEIIYKEKQ